MTLLQELLVGKKSKSVKSDNKYTRRKINDFDDIGDTVDTYVQLPNPQDTKKGQFPTTDKAQNSLINYLWLYQNSDAS